MPLYKGAVEVYDKHYLELLSPEGWFEQGHNIDGYTTNVDRVNVTKLKSGSVCDQLLL